MKNCRNGKAVYSCIVTMKKRCEALLVFSFFSLLLLFQHLNLDVISWIKKSRGPFHPHTLIVALMAFLVARVACIDTGILFSHTPGRGGGGNGRWRGHWARLNYRFQYLSDVSEEIRNAFIAWEKLKRIRHPHKTDQLAVIRYRAHTVKLRK